MENTGAAALISEGAEGARGVIRVKRGLTRDNP